MNTSIILGIVGSRSYNDWEFFWQVVNEWTMENGHPDKIISGGANGVDNMAKRYAHEKAIAFDEINVIWSHGRNAGPVRNTTLVSNITHLLAFPSVLGRGTQDVIQKACSKRIPIEEWEVGADNKTVKRILS